MSGAFPDRLRNRRTVRAVAVLLALLILPTLAALRLSRTLDPRLVPGYALLISVVAYLLYWRDKRRAQSGDWRTPEFILHVVELFGGWPGAWLAQQFLRHKTSKTSYQVKFWLIIALHEFASLDFLLGWRFTTKALLLFHR